MRRRRMLYRIMKTTGTSKLLYGFLAVFLLVSVLIWLTEPTLTTLWDSIWYCFTVTTTIGFGDQYATAVLSRILTIILSVYSIVVIAILTAVITNFLIEYMKRRAEMSAGEFLDKLERLPELSQEELAELSEKVKSFNRSKDRTGD